MTQTDLYESTWTQARAALAKLAKADKEAVDSAAANWLWEEGGQPQVALLEEKARNDAMFWAETASPIELECYMLAACMRLERSKSMFHRRHIKRLVASLWRRMWPEDQAAFIEWAGKNRNGAKDE